MPGTSRTSKPDDRPLVDRYIDQDVARYAGGRADATLRGSGVSVWAVVAFLRVYDNDRRKVAEHFDVSPDEVEAALAYYRFNKNYIDARITLNEA